MPVEFWVNENKYLFLIRHTIEGPMAFIETAENLKDAY